MGRTNQTLRRVVLFGPPLLYIVLGILHPMEDPVLGDPTGLFIGLHFGQMFLIAGLAYSLWLLVEGLESRAATVTRALSLPFVVLYTTLDAIAGLGMGTWPGWPTRPRPNSKQCSARSSTTSASRISPAT